jgi:hypothetical protein
MKMKILEIDTEDRELLELALEQYIEWRREDRYDEERTRDIARAERLVKAIRTGARR